MHVIQQLNTQESTQAPEEVKKVEKNTGSCRDICVSISDTFKGSADHLLCINVMAGQAKKSVHRAAHIGATQLNVGRKLHYLYLVLCTFTSVFNTKD